MKLLKLILLFFLAFVCAGEVAADARAETAHDTVGDAVNTAILSGCSLHVLGANKIEQKNKKKLATLSIVLPDGVELASDKAPIGWIAALLFFGPQTFARIDSKEGPVWLSGFSQMSMCQIFAEGANTPENLKAIHSHLQDKNVPWKLVEDRTQEILGSQSVTEDYVGELGPNKWFKLSLSYESSPNPTGKRAVKIFVGSTRPR